MIGAEAAGSGQATLTESNGGIYTGGGFSAEPDQARVPAGTNGSQLGDVMPAWRSLCPERVPRLEAEGLDVSMRDKWCLADLSVPGEVIQTVCPVKAILDTGSGVTTVSEEVIEKLQCAFPDVSIISPLESSQQVRVADGRALDVQRKTCPLRIALHTSFGPVTLDPISLAVMPGVEDVLILGNATLERLGLDIYASLAECGRKRVDRSKVVPQGNYIAC